MYRSLTCSSLVGMRLVNVHENLCGQLHSLHLLNLLQGLSPAGKTDSQFFLLPHHQKPKSLLKALKGITATVSGGTSTLPVSDERVKGKETVKLSPSMSVFEKEEEKEVGEKEKEEKEVVVRRGGGMSVLGPEKFSHRIKQE